MTDHAPSYTRAPGLPLFERPPVTEVSMGVSFEGLKLRVIDLGDLHRRFMSDYPVAEEHPPVPLQIERFGRAAQSGVEFQFLDFPPMPMVVFLAEDRASLIQIQDNRFHCAWRRVEEDTAYPRYEKFREGFLRNIKEFADQIGREDLPVTQAEINYINDIPMDSSLRPDVLASLLPLSDIGQSSGMAPLDASSASTAQHFTFKTKEGVDYARLHIAAELVPAGSDTVRLALTYRGEPSERFPNMSAIEMMMAFLDEGHDQIVRAFAANTTAEAQKGWGRSE
ncbi:TIGR04255 family protein [Kribbella sp. NPDC049584]|uniref:TIGR04255 family protein n=1 Tax=Kribbella sp. NPDC049584 TaxID=3154833 RepID=UPI00341E2386